MRTALCSPANANVLSEVPAFNAVFVPEGEALNFGFGLLARPPNLLYLDAIAYVVWVHARPKEVYAYDRVTLVEFICSRHEAMLTTTS